VRLLEECGFLSVSVVDSFWATCEKTAVVAEQFADFVREAIDKNDTEILKKIVSCSGKILHAAGQLGVGDLVAGVLERVVGDAKTLPRKRGGPKKHRG